MSGNIVCRAFAVSTLALAFSSGPALAYCSAPSAPYCATSYSDFSDEHEFDSCKRDMDSYQDEVNSHLECLQREVDDAVSQAKRDSEEAISEYNDAVESFNRRAE